MLRVAQSVHALPGQPWLVGVGGAPRDSGHEDLLSTIVNARDCGWDGIAAGRVLHGDDHPSTSRWYAPGATELAATICELLKYGRDYEARHDDVGHLVDLGDMRTLNARSTGARVAERALSLSPA